MHTIVITGGHHNSALVVAQELLKNGVKVVWLGHRHASRGDTNDSAEYTEVTTAGIKFYDLQAGRGSLSPAELLRLPVGFFHARAILQKTHTQALLTFGSYLGLAGALAARSLGIPVYLHEQTVIAGRANKLIGHLAKKIYLTWPESAQYFTPTKVIVVGLPLRSSILTAKPKNLFPRAKPTLLVMGGKQGAHAINQFVFAHLPDLLTHFNLVHQTGTTSLTRDYEHALSLQNSLGSLSDCYLPVGYITENEIGSYLRSAKLYLGRSGAHICYELGILGLSSILVPLMSTHDHEQHKNAEILVQAKLGLIIPQPELTFTHFLAKATKLMATKPVPLRLSRTSALKLTTNLLADLT